MKNALKVALLLSFGFAALNANASQALAQKNSCTACHSADKKLIGPSFQEIASKYSGKDGAGATLAASIRKGSSGKFGAMPMPPQPGVSEADARTLADWILAGTPK